MENFSDELLVTILRFVPPLALLRSSHYVSKRFSRLIGSDEFWRTNPDSPMDQGGFPKLTRHQLQLFHIFRFWKDEGGDVHGVPGFMQLGSLLTTREEARLIRTGSQRRTCAASSTDHWNELVDNLLSSGDDDHENFRADIYDGARFLHALRPSSNATWWSSRPSQDRNSSDTLVFCTNCPLAIVSDVRIKALMDPYLLSVADTKVYSWNTTMVRAYRVPMEFLTPPTTPDFLAGSPCSFEDVQSLTRTHFDPFLASLLGNDDEFNAALVPSDQDTIDRLLDSATQVYEHTFEDAVGPRELQLVLSVPVLANIITVTLVGKNFEQHPGSGYYSCVERLHCSGIPLYLHPGQARERRHSVD